MRVIKWGGAMETEAKRRRDAEDGVIMMMPTMMMMMMMMMNGKQHYMHIRDFFSHKTFFGT